MTVNTTEITSGPYTGNGVTTQFSYTFRVETKNQLIVYETDTNGAVTILTVDTDYTVTNLGVDGGGLITRVAGALPTGYTWYIVSNYQNTQTTDFDSQGGFFPEVHEAAFDKVTFLIQQLNDVLTRRALLFKNSESRTDAQNELPDVELGKVLSWDTDGSLINETIDNLTTDVEIASTVDRYDSVAALIAATPSSSSALTTSYLGGWASTVAGPKGGAFFHKTGNTGTASTTDLANGVVYDAGGNEWKLSKNQKLNLYMFGARGASTAGDEVYIQYAIDYANGEGGATIYIPIDTYKCDGQLVAKSNVELINESHIKAEFDFDGYLVPGSTSRCMTATNINNFKIRGVIISADVLGFTNDGLDLYGARFDGSTNCVFEYCEFHDHENGLAFRNGCVDCKAIDIVAKDCGSHSVSSWGIASSPNERMTFNKIRSYSTQTLEHLTPTSGCFFEETYDSDMSNIIVYNCNSGIRIENSCDNRIRNLTAYKNWANGVSLYNYAQRNVVNNVVVFDNNRANEDAVDTTIRGNDNTGYHGLLLSLAFNNTVSNVVAFQTKAAEVPFNSGSDEPWLGSKVRGVTSGATGRVRNFTVTSGDWSTNDAAGTMYLVEVSGTFNSSETIENVTTRIPYNSGGTEKPRRGDTLSGVTSGATGTLLWPSQQSDTSGDWSLGNSDGYIYLIDVTGTFNASENLNNDTTGTGNIATTNGAVDTEDTDIATSNGTFVAATGTGYGFQKYGVGINTRNLAGSSTASSFNSFTNIQAFNNDLGEYEDRGLYNTIEGLNTSFNSLIRNA